MYSREEITSGNSPNSKGTTMTAPDEDDDLKDAFYIRADIYHKALADRDTEIARLQARLDAGPSVEQLRDWALSLPKGGYRRSAEQMIETANRMEAANGK